MGFLISKASLVFTQLMKTFTKILIIYYFDSKCHIRIQTDAIDYAIGGVLSKLTTKKVLIGQVTYGKNNLFTLS